MRKRFVFLGFLLLATVAAQQNDEPPPNGTIFGIAIGQDGQPAKGVRLIACPSSGSALATRLPSTRTNDAGKYRFENLPWWGRYTVYAEDEDAGYSLFSTGPGDSYPLEVEISPEHREAEFKVYLPPKAGFLQIHLTNRRTGVAISGMVVTMMALENPESPLFTGSSSSNRVILVPPDKNLLLHVTSDGFREWDESTGRGKPLHLSSGTRETLPVQLEPSD